MKTPLAETSKTFDLKFLMVGDSKSGKTHFCGTYTRGPVHFYMLDPGGEKTLHKLNKDREHPITIDKFSMRSDGYSAFYKQLQTDERDGFFEKMAEQNGLVVLPDSLSAASDMALAEIAKRNGRTLESPDKPMRIQDWGQLGAWMKTLVSFANDIPCSAAVIAHLYTETDDSGAVIKRYPMISGNFRTSMGRMFDEVYLLEPFGDKHRIYFKPRNLFTAGSRIFTCKQATDITMDTLADAYIAGDSLSKLT